jgi:hypothetical protein
LHAPQAFDLQRLAPELQPRGSAASFEFLGCEIRVDHRLDPAPRRVRPAQARAHVVADPACERPERGDQQSVLVAEVVRDEAGRDVRARRDLGQSRACESDFR